MKRLSVEFGSHAAWALTSDGDRRRFQRSGGADFRRSSRITYRLRQRDVSAKTIMMLGDAIVCSSHTISGVLPGSAVPARHGFRKRVAACAAAGYSGLCLHYRDYRDLRAHGWSDAELARILHENAMRDVGVEFLTDWFLEGAEAEAARR
ncbi:MAG: hypothetical protein JNK46_07870 [Methylobacteriaceae bacterium]|nr:hypothetical protein [Methylobacteriaceae bacterium]